MKANIIILLVLFSPLAQALEFNRCVDGNGVAHYTNLPLSTLDANCRQNWIRKIFIFATTISDFNATWITDYQNPLKSLATRTMRSTVSLMPSVMHWMPIKRWNRYWRTRKRPVQTRQPSSFGPGQRLSGRSWRQINHPPYYA